MTVADQEVGEPDEAAVEHGGLIHHRGVVGDGTSRRVGGCRQPGGRVGRPANDSHRVAELVAQLVESASFMRATENGGSRHQFVVNCDGRSPA
ncbi:Uncharacterised protein [Mycobacterium tuberculosis]|nr:hypothetical protein MRGA423_07820 [Mycobacterium tuberculosis RGTB423]CFS04072.1 Uncharacterised protein [Mycobacterium tuberculosis]CKQ92494.1 Uncharacterised protein [Mycobacterium tuberculosis]CKR32579.1 Uncharacterised protein [Mycobacterium tuberculosis]CKR40086.1 Uncharacterised protein [Mycobacterium tuberculosis]